MSAERDAQILTARRRKCLAAEKVRLAAAEAKLAVAQAEGGDVHRAQQRVWFHTNQVKQIEHRLGTNHQAPSTSDGAFVLPRGRHAA